MPENIDSSLGEKYGDYAGFETDSSPAEVNYYGENPLNEVKRLLQLYIQPSSRILDLGCGAGQTLCQFAPHVQEAWGMDVSQELLAGARERVRSLGLSNVRLVAGDTANQADLAHLPDNYFDIAFTESGPGLNAALVEKLTPEAYFIQEVGGHYSSYQLQDILGRLPYTNFAYHGWDQSHIQPMADIGLLPISFKQYFWEIYFRDLAHLELYASKEGVLSNWRLTSRPYEAKRDRPALELYARYNMTPKGIRMLYHIQVLIWRRADVHYYPIDETG